MERHEERGEGSGRLTWRTVNDLRPREKAYRVFDRRTSGFHVKVTPTGRKVFFVDYRRPGGQKVRYRLGAFGVLDVQDGLMRGIVEKPAYDNLISAGIYVLAPEVLARVPRATYVDMPELLLSLANDGKPVGVFVLEDEWVDVGRHDDLERAKRNFTPGQGA